MVATVDVGADGGAADGPDHRSIGGGDYGDWLATAFVENQAQLMRHFLERGLDEEDARDAVSSLFERLYSRPVRDVRSVGGLLRAAAKYRIADHFRDRARRWALSIDDDEVARVASLTLAERAGLSIEDAAALRDVVRRTLTRRQQEVIHARFVLDLPSAEVAAMYGISVAMVDRQRSDALQVLRRAVDVRRRAAGRLGPKDKGGNA